ncbi:hypothetical protein BDL97_11G110500 [Sphagnum fallax]|jgi:hypothetical protein|nr:hypothetical protein BDL97_11G110500 [Sphagnum fallax]
MSHKLDQVQSGTILYDNRVQFTSSKLLDQLPHRSVPAAAAGQNHEVGSMNNHGQESRYKGIRYRPELNRYISEIRPALPRKRKIWLGTYKTAIEAARAFDAGIFYTGRKIPFNFPEFAKQLPPLDDNLTQDERHTAIQKRAKLAAAMKHVVDSYDGIATTSTPSSGLTSRSTTTTTTQQKQQQQYTSKISNAHLPFYQFLPSPRD